MEEEGEETQPNVGVNGKELQLADELSRRLRETSTPPPQLDQSESPTTRILCDEHHHAGEDSAERKQLMSPSIVSRWRQKEKLKTTNVALVLCLNIGVDPPDVIKISPCARLECWVDPMSMQPAKALETIGKNLQAQYERWQPRAKYKMHLDPTTDDVKKLCTACRKSAKNERVLFHYNGHGVPRPTANGELWVFNSRYTQYIPLSVFELQQWLGSPCIYVLDCSAAGLVINSLRSLINPTPGASPANPNNHALKEVIILAACGAHEVLPQTPELPADVFTACLTTPIKVALRWFCSRSLLRHDGITKELIDKIPGRQTERKTPLGELNWIFTAITDTIAWNLLPRALFQKLFRSDLLVASLFRNFLLAARIMAGAGCTPTSFPRLPPTHNHPMWQAWDMAAETCLMQLPTLLSDPGADFLPSPFFSEQLTAFELWLQHGSKDKNPPEQLPIVLQVLLSQVHRLRALVLLGRFLDMGPWAVDLALSVGIFPYILKLLQTTSTDLRPTLVFIWCKVLALDKSCQSDLIKDNGHHYFIKYLDSADGTVDLYSRAQACFVLCCICDGHPKGQALCAHSNLLAVLLKWLRNLFPPQVPFATPGHPLLLKWLCLCLGKLCMDMPEISLMAIREGAADLLVQLLTVASPDIRAGAVFGLGCLIHSCPDIDPSQVQDHPLSMVPTEDRLPAEQLIANAVRQVVYDPSVLVRCELAVLYARFVRGHAAAVGESLSSTQRKLNEFLRTQNQSHQSSSQGTSSQSLKSMSMDTSQNIEKPVGGAGGGGGGGVQPGSSVSSQSQEAPNSPSVHRPPSPYSTILESMQMLALDPSPKVSKIGRDVLRIAHFEIVIPFPSTPSIGGLGTSLHKTAPSLGASIAQKLKKSSWLSGPASTGPPPQARPPSPPPPATSKPSPTSANVVTAGSLIMSSGSNPSAPPSGASLAGHSATASISGSPPSRAGEPAGFSRHLFTLVPTGQAAGGSGRGGVLFAPGSSLNPYPPAGGSIGRSPPNRSLQGSSAPGSADVQPTAPGFFSFASSDNDGGDRRSMGGGSNQAPASRASPPPPASATVSLPESSVYSLSKEYFSRPMLEPQSSAWGEAEGVLASPWTAAVDLRRKAKRIEEIDLGLNRCKALITPKLREQVYSIETGSDEVTSVCFHPYHPVVCLADSRGMIKVLNYLDSTMANSFHVATGGNDSARSLPSHVTFLRQLNELDGPMLLCGSSDGSVRIWRNHTLRDTQTMATALQAATIHLPPAHGHATAFEWSPQRSLLFAAGGSHPEMMYCWDLNYEMCSNMISMAIPGSLSPPHVERILLGQTDPNLVLVSCNDSIVRLFDLRASGTGKSPVMTVQPYKQPSTGLAFEPNHKPGLLISVSEKGEMKFFDLRMTSSPVGGGLSSPLPSPGHTPGLSNSPNLVHTLAAHSNGGVTSLVAHPHAPLLATATVNRLVKVWTDQGDTVGAIRAQPAHAQARLGPVTCMAFHPYQPLLVAGGHDSVCTVYAIDNNSGGLSSKPSEVRGSSNGGGLGVGPIRTASAFSTLPSSLLATLGVTKSGGGTGSNNNSRNNSSQLPRVNPEDQRHATFPQVSVPRVGGSWDHGVRQGRASDSSSVSS